MASTITPDTNRSIQRRSILEIDKSTEPFPSQIVEISQILGITLEAPSYPSFLEKKIEPHHPRYRGPREEWALRWLLKKMQDAGLDRGSLCTEYRSWLLLRELFLLTTLSNTARLLNAHNFIGLLQKALEWLYEHANDVAEFPNPLYEDALAVADSSSTTVEVPSIQSIVKSRKRKRDDPQHILSSEAVKSNSDCEILYLSISGALVQLQRLTRDLPSAPHGFAVEHLKSALRGSPEQTATILQNSVSLATWLLKKKPSYSVQNEARVLRICLTSAVEIWYSHSIANDDTPGHQINQIFSDRCLMPILYLLTTYQNLNPAYSKDDKIFKFLEEILIKNILLPVRASYLNHKSSSNAYDGESSSSSAQNLLAPLSKMAHTKFGQISPRKSSNSALLPISLLFSIAIRCLPRNTPKQRSLEDSWLQNLFSQLAQHASVSNSASENYILTLNQMLRDVADHNVRLAAFKVEALLSEVSEALDKKIDIPTYWDLIDVCIEIDANIFINAFSLNSGNRGNKQKEPKMHLASLLSLVTNNGWSTVVDTSNYKIKLGRFILPLANAFAKGRDLIGFISLWHEQLAICQKNRPCGNADTSAADYARSVWEDEELLQLVAQLVKTSLTVGQIEILLQKANFDVAPSEATVSNDSEFVADLVVLDCITNASLSESYLDQLANFVHAAYISIVNIILSGTGWSKEHTWRLWRILITFNEHWSMPRDSGLRLAEEQVLSKALGALDFVGPPTPENLIIKQNPAKDVHIFMFMLSVASSSETNEISSRVCLVVERLLDFIKVVQNAGQTSSVDSEFLGYVSQVIAYPYILSNLKPDSKRVFFRQIYLGFVAFKKSQQPTKDAFYYILLWHTLLASDALQEHRLLINSFRDFQFSTFIDAASQRDFRYWISEFRNYEVAFQALQSTSVRAFKRSQRSQIFKGIFNVIVRCCLQSPTHVIDHIDLLTRYIENAHQSLSLLGKRQGDADDNQFEGLSADEAPLIGLIQSFENDGDETPPNHHIVVALRQLGEKTLQCCNTMLTEDHNIEYLVSFFEQLIRMFSDDSTACSFMAASALLIASLSFYANYIANLPEEKFSKFSRFSSFRLSHVESLCEFMCLAHQIKTKIQETQLRELGILFEYMALYADILSCRSDLSEILSQLSIIARIFHRQNSKISEDSERKNTSIERVYVLLLRLETILRTTNGDVRSILGAMNSRKNLKSRVEKDRLLRYLQDVIAGLSPDLKLELLEIFSKADDNSNLDSDNLLLLKKLVLTQDSSVNPELRNSVLSQIYSNLCHKISQSMDHRVSMLAMQNMNILLQRESRVISQWHIDNTIAAIAIVSSHIKSHSQEKHNGIVYIGLSRIFSSILVLHRTKLGGRYHLILPALQNLLRCLFIPYEKPDAPSSSNTCQDSTLGEAHATAYSRLLTTICDPSVSAVTTRSRKRELNDETKKARSIAGQHLHYLIMEYCVCQLKGRLPAEMKKMLMPGFYAVFNVVSQEVMRTLSAAMDAETREVFKALYEDYRRFGKWQGS